MPLYILGLYEPSLFDKGVRVVNGKKFYKHGREKSLTPLNSTVDVND